MKFEEILPLMREGKKARLASDIEGEYWICGYQGLMSDMSDKMPVIIRINKNGCAPSTTYDWGIARWMIMAEDWVVYERA